jgi:hypothetical protein
MTRCEWAGCRAPSVEIVEQWPMCAEHKAEHEALEQEDARPSRHLDRIALLHSKGWTDAQIAESLGCHKESVRHHRAALGLRSNYDSEARSRARRDRGRRRDVDSPAKRCHGCGEWVWSRRPCGVCEAVA